MSRPTPIVEVSLSATPLDPAPNWTPIPNVVGVKSISWARGRNFELDENETSRITVVCDDKNRLLDPFNPASTYAPLLPLKAIRIRATHGSTYGCVRGYITSYGLDWKGSGNGTTRVTIDAYDVQTILARAKLRLPYDWEVLRYSPTGYWRLRESDSATVAADYSGNGRNGSYFGTPDFGNTDPVSDAVDGAVRLDGASWMFAGRPPAVSGVVDFTALVFVRWTVGQDDTGFITQTPLGATVFDGWMLTPNAFGSIAFVLAGALPRVVSPGAYNDGAWHLALATRIGANLTLYVDGAQVATAATAGGVSINAYDVRVGRGTGGLFIGDLHRAAILPVGLTSAQVAELWASRNSWAGDLTGTRFGKVCDMVGIPTGDRAIQAGQSTMPAGYDYEDRNALETLREIVEADGGFMFVDRDGKLTFKDRHDRMQNHLTPVATFGDTGTELDVEQLAPRLDDQRIANDIRISRRDGPTVTALDPASVLTYGGTATSSRTLEKTIVVESDDTTRDMAAWLLQAYKDAHPRIERQQVRPIDNDTLWDTLLGLELSDRIRVMRRPPGGGVAIQQDSFVERIAANWDGLDWGYDLQLSPADVAAAWVLGDATYGVLGSTSKLGY